MRRMLITLLVGCVGFGAAAQAGIYEPQVRSIKLLSEVGSTRATRYLQSNKIITLNGKTHVAWLDSGSKTMIATYDHATATWGPVVHVGDGVDNHGGPALTVDSEGYLHIIYGPHGHPFHYAKSAAPNDSSSWVDQGDFSTAGTYPSAVIDDQDTLHIIYRYHTGSAPKLAYQRKPKGGAWSSPVVLAEPPSGYSGYTHYHPALTIADDDTLHIAYNIYYGGAAKRTRHMMSTDGGNTWRQADGTAVTLPVTPDTGGFISEAADALKIQNIATDSQGDPWFTAVIDDRFELYHHDGTAWQVSEPLTLAPPELADLGVWKALPMALDSSDRLYVFPIFGEVITGGCKGDIYAMVSTDGGSSYDALHVFSADETLPHIGINPERPTGHNTVETPWFLFSTGEKTQGFHDVRVVQLGWVPEPTTVTLLTLGALTVLPRRHRRGGDRA